MKKLVHNESLKKLDSKYLRASSTRNESSSQVLFLYCIVYFFDNDGTPVESTRQNKSCRHMRSPHSFTGCIWGDSNARPWGANPCLMLNNLRPGCFLCRIVDFASIKQKLSTSYVNIIHGECAFQIYKHFYAKIMVMWLIFRFFLISKCPATVKINK